MTNFLLKLFAFGWVCFGSGLAVALTPAPWCYAASIVVGLGISTVGRRLEERR